MLSTQTHAEIMAYLTDYGSLSGEKSNGIATTNTHGAFDDPARLAVAGVPTEISERTEVGNIAPFDSDLADVVPDSTTGNLLDLGLQFCWPDGFGA